MKDYRGEWQELFSTLGYVGKSGIGQASEGNDVTPQGTFSVNTVFGIKEDPGCKLEYTKVNKYHYWICDSSSEYYNQMIDTRITDYRPTSRSIHIIDEQGRCNYCLAFDYNAEGIPGKGSAYFLHCIDNRKYTTGGISVPESIMKRILVTVQPQCLIVIDNKSTLTNS